MVLPQFRDWHLQILQFLILQIWSDFDSSSKFSKDAFTTLWFILIEIQPMSSSKQQLKPIK